MRASIASELSRFKLRASLMMREKGTLIERDKTPIRNEKEHVSKYKG